MDKIFFLIDDIPCSGGTERVTCTLGVTLHPRCLDSKVM